MKKVGQAKMTLIKVLLGAMIGVLFISLNSCSREQEAPPDCKPAVRDSKAWTVARDYPVISWSTAKMDGNCLVITGKKPDCAIGDIGLYWEGRKMGAGTPTMRLVLSAPIEGACNNMTEMTWAFDLMTLKNGSELIGPHIIYIGFSERSFRFDFGE